MLRIFFYEQLNNSKLSKLAKLSDYYSDSNPNLISKLVCVADSASAPVPVFYFYPCPLR